MDKKIPEYLEAELQTAKDEYKVKTMSYITITKFEYEKLKEEVTVLRKELSKTRIRRDKYKRKYLKEKWKNKSLKNNWNELKEWLRDTENYCADVCKKYSKSDLVYRYYRGAKNGTRDCLIKKQEIESGNNE